MNETVKLPSGVTVPKITPEEADRRRYLSKDMLDMMHLSPVGQPVACSGEGDDLTCVDVPDMLLRYEVRGDVMRISVPRAVIGLDHDNFTLWFKVADSREKYRNIEDFYDKGDVAPLGRLNFVYRGE